MDRGHLARVYAQLGSETEAPRASRVVSHPLVVRRFDRDTIDRGASWPHRVAIATANRSGASSDSSASQVMPVSAMKSIWPTASRNTAGVGANALTA